MLRQAAGVRHAAARMGLVVEEVDGRKGHAEGILLEHLASAAADFRHARRAARPGGKVLEDSQPPLAHHALGDFGDDAEHASDAALVVVDWAVGEGVIRLLGEAAALES